ncbi:MAG: prepilin-type N-terminal cleavage/methylation domain-containing protein [Elusimicrobia bacterium]|nr:prepilin-type N-terminal cleavage/methylation domain-containing protein [Elusimicrobiota bacterium]
MKKTKGFTLVELVIVIVIVGILSVVAVPIYRGYTRKAMATEGKALLGTIQTSEKVYFAEYAAFQSVTLTSFNSELDVDARANKYFTSFVVSANTSTGDTAAYTAVTAGNGGASGIGLTLVASSKGAPTFIDTGLNN